VTSPAYLDFKDALAALAPPEAVKGAPIPVVIMANLNRLADQVFTPRALVAWDNNTFNGPQVVLRPTGGGGILIQDIEWFLGGGNSEANVIRSDAAVVIPSTNAARMETGGPLTRFLVGLRDFEAIGGIPFGSGSETMPGTVFVAPGDLFVVGRNGVGMTAFQGSCTVQEIPTTAMGL